MAFILFRRLAQGLIIVWLTTTLTFFLIHAAPGEPFAGMLEDPRSTPELRAAWRERYGLNQPLAAQYGRFLSSVASGNLGDSFTYQRPVASVLADAIPRTMLLMGTALVIGFVAGTVLGTLQGRRAGGWFDRLTGSASVLVASLPDFWLALLAVLIFAGTLALLVAATVSRYQRAALIDVLPSTWLRTARAKGVPEGKLVFRHALRNALLPTITLAGLAVPALLGGAVFIESTFAWQGMGSLAVQAVSDSDYPLVLAIVLFSSTLVVLGAILADLASAAADPRQRDA